MIKILIIDDDPMFLNMLRKILGKCDFEVSTLEDPRYSMEKFYKNPVDIILTDILMPRKDGFEVINEFKIHNPELKVIAMSGGGEIDAKDYLVLAKSIGADHIIKKPFKIEELLKILSP